MYLHPQPLAIAICSAQLRPGNRVALNVELDVSGGAPEWVQLIPAGPQVVGRDGRQWLFDQPDAVIANSMLGADLPLDWEHSTELKARQGDEAPAAAWITQLENRAGALWGRISWNERGAASVASREYKYLSPVFIYDRDTLRIQRLTSAGLTNSPNLQLPALNHEEVQPVKFPAALLALLALNAEATEEQVIAAINTLKGERDTAMNRVNNPSLDKFVPRADHDAAVARATNAEKKLADIEKKAVDTAIDAEVDAALKAGKITPATVEYHKASCREEGGLARFREFVKVAPVIGDPATLTAVQDKNTARNAEEKKIDAMFGNSADDIKKYGTATA